VATSSGGRRAAPGWDAGGLDRRRPLAEAEVVEVKDAAARRREDERRVEPRRDLPEGLGGAGAERKP
jgi:hypothetical protein